MKSMAGTLCGMSQVVQETQDNLPARSSIFLVIYYLFFGRTVPAMAELY